MDTAEAAPNHHQGNYDGGSAGKPQAERYTESLGTQTESVELDEEALAVRLDLTETIAPSLHFRNRDDAIAWCRANVRPK